jgi:hypothetical protein
VHNRLFDTSCSLLAAAKQQRHARPCPSCLQALSTLASRHVELLWGYSSYLANILDHLEGFSNAQLQQVFSMFAALTARPPATGAQGTTGAGASSSAAGMQYYAGLCKHAVPLCL